MSTLPQPKPLPQPIQKAARDYLSEIKTDAKPRPTSAIIYGPPGVGKTSMAAYFPGVVFMPDYQEDGINTLKANGLVPSDIAVFPSVNSWDMMMACLSQLNTGTHKHRILAMDSIGGFELLCHDYVCRRDYEGNRDKFLDFGRGPDVACGEIRRMINALDDLRVNKAMGVILLGHSRVKPWKNPDGSDFGRYTVDVHEKTWGLLHKWADVVAFANFHIEVAGADAKGRGGKGRGGTDRLLYCEHSATYDAKNRSGLVGDISMGESGEEAFKNFSAAMKAARKISPNPAADAAQKGDTP